VHAVRDVRHVYYIPLESGKEVGHQARCMDCGIKLSIDISEFSGVEKSEPGDIITLMNQTRPTLSEDYRERLNIERKLLRPNSLGLDEEKRFKLLLEPFQLVQPLFLDHYEETKIDRQTGAGCIGTVLVGLVLLIALDFEAGSLGAQVAFSIVGLGFLYTVVAATTIDHRHLNRWVIPTLARSLRRLRPTQIELEQILEVMIQDVSKHFRKIKAKKVLQCIDHPNQHGDPFDPRLTRSPSQL